MMLKLVKYTPTELAMINRVRRYDWAKLEGLWKRIKAGTATGWSPGKALEYMFVRAFELSGAEVVYPYNNEVRRIKEQFDGFVFVKELGAGFIIECKDWREPVSFDEVAKLYGRLSYRISSTFGIYLSRNDFTASALESLYVLHPHNILLWSFAEIDECFIHHKFLDALKYKYKYAMATADPMIAVMDGFSI